MPADDRAGTGSVTDGPVTDGPVTGSSGQRDAWVPAPRDDPGASDTVAVGRGSGGSRSEGRGSLSRGSAGSGLAWLVRSVTHVPGVLHLRDGRLRFVSTRGVLFDATPEALGVVPALTTRGGFRLTVGGERLRLHVVRFAGAVDVADDLRVRETAAGLLTAGEASAGSVWRRLMTQPPVSVAEASAPPPSAPSPESPEPSVDPTAGAGDGAGSGSPGAGPTPRLDPVRGRAWRSVRARRACAAPGPWY